MITKNHFWRGNEFYASTISRDIFYNLGMIAVHIYKCFVNILWRIKVAKEIGIILHNLLDPIVLSLRQIVTLEGEKKNTKTWRASPPSSIIIFLVEYKKYLLAVEPSITSKFCEIISGAAFLYLCLCYFTRYFWYFQGKVA